MWLGGGGDTCRSASSGAYAEGKCACRSARKADRGATFNNVSASRKRRVS